MVVDEVDVALDLSQDRSVAGHDVDQPMDTSLVAPQQCLNIQERQWSASQCDIGHDLSTRRTKHTYGVKFEFLK
jgi:hypothetical protein